MASDSRPLLHSPGSLKMIASAGGGLSSPNGRGSLVVPDQPAIQPGGSSATLFCSMLMRLSLEQPEQKECAQPSSSQRTSSRLPSSLSDVSRLAPSRKFSGSEPSSLLDNFLSGQQDSSVSIGMS